jgi:predicted ABC-type transport system involved in lysophospholipase L1 biosynthesis ATPase subunit
VVTHDPNVAAWCERHVEIVDGRVLSDVRTGMAA